MKKKLNSEIVQFPQKVNLSLFNNLKSLSIYMENIFFMTICHIKINFIFLLLWLLKTF